MKPLISFLIALCLLCLLPFALADEEPFAPQGNYRVFCADGLYGVQTLDGETVIPARFDGIQPFVGDLCVVELSDEEDEMYEGLWRLSTGEELLPCEFADLYLTDTAVITARWADEGGYEVGDRLFDPETGAFVQISDEAQVSGIWDLASGQFFILNGSFIGKAPQRLIRPDGTRVMDEDLDYVDVYATPASDGILAVVKADEWDFRYFDTKADRWLDGTYDWAYAFADGFAAVSGPGLGDMYVIDETGAPVTPVYKSVAYDNSGEPHYGAGLFAVKEDDGWRIIRVHSDAEPDVLFGPVPCIRDPLYLGNQVFAMPAEGGMTVYSGVLDASVMLPGATGYLYGFLTDNTVFASDGKKGFLFDDLSVIEPAYDDCVEFLGDYGFVEIDGLWYPIDRNGQVYTSVAYPNVAVSDDCTYYIIEYHEDNVLCLSPALEPISHRSFCEHG